MGQCFLDLVRVLQPSTFLESDGREQAGLGRVDADWRRLDGGTARGPVVVVR
jgi:hypothetical protein